jgi:CDP-glycerol glycerophosphotransferase (TagB/SpsB family)
MQLIFCPHGQSDKGLNAPLLAPFGTQDAVLLYGDLLIEMLKTTNVWPSITRYALVGNYRLTYYLQNRQFMDDLVKKHIFSHLPQQPTLLYAPTWQDADESSSFFNEMFDLLRNLPSHWNLIIKPHPRLEEKTPAQFHKLLNYAEKHTNALIVTDFPFVYPILAQSNAYLGDFSSVGYDFLYFQKPMFFFSHPILKPGRLQTCGLLLENNKNPFSYIENHIISMILHFALQNL